MQICFFHELFATPNQVSLSMDWLSSLRWNSVGSVKFVAVPIFSQGQRGADESLMLETAVRPQEFFLLFVYALFLLLVFELVVRAYFNLGPLCLLLLTAVVGPTPHLASPY